MSLKAASQLSQVRRGDVMSMIDRYRKPGGFNQLLLLIETCDRAKQEKFLAIIKNEDVVWGEAIASKMINLDRIFSWNNDVLTEIFGTLQDLTVATILHGCKPDVVTKIQTLFAHGRWRKVDDLFKICKPSPGELFSMQIKVVETVRKMAIDHQIRFDKFEPALIVEDGIEDRLSHTQNFMPEPTPAATEHLSLVPKETTELSFGKYDTTATGEQSSELLALKKKITELSKENAILRHELSVSKNKLEQIKKIA